MSPTAECQVCARTGARNGRAPHKYCDAHIPEGQAAGHVKRPRPQPAAASSSTLVSMPEEWKLLSIERIFDCRCALTFPPLLPPKRPCQHALRLTRLARMRCRCCKLDGKDAVDVENGLITEEEMRSNVEYLVLGHFERKEGDTKGKHTMLWLALSDFDDSAVSNEVVDAKLDGWELQGAQIRKEARRLQRQGAAET